MKVTAIETIRLAEFPNLLWVQVHTDEGLVGLGETFYGQMIKAMRSSVGKPAYFHGGRGEEVNSTFRSGHGSTITIRLTTIRLTRPHAWSTHEA